MIIVLDNEIEPELRYLGPELVRQLPNAEYHAFPDESATPDVDAFDGVVISGSTASVYDGDHADWIDRQISLFKQCLTEKIPTLGICFGHQLVNYSLGGTVQPDQLRTGFVRLTDIEESESLLEGVSPVVPVLHGDIVTELGDGLIRTASSAYNDCFCTRHESAPVWTVQFHPELTPRLAARIDEFQSDWNGFSESTAERVLENFTRHCEL
jgi:GMP synthase (glutamine-hydrolysing)